VPDGGAQQRRHKKLLGSPVGWARAYLHLVQGADLEVGSWRESLAISAWRKQQRIELLRTIALAQAFVNPEKAQKAMTNLLEEMFPEVAEDRQKAVDKALDIMKKESGKVYIARAIDEKEQKGWIKKANAALKHNR